MIPRSALIQLGRQVAEDLAGGHDCEILQNVGDALAADSKALATLLDLIAKEGARKKSDDQLVAAYALLLGQGLEVLRYGVERGRSEAVANVEAIKAQLRSLVQAGKLAPGILMAVLQQFASAKLDLGAELQDLLDEVMETCDPPPMSATEIGGFLGDLARHFDGDPFAIHGQLAEQAAAFPETHRAGMALALLQGKEPALREAAIGWLLDSGPITRRDVAGLLEQAVARDLVSGSMLRRMIAMRNWLPEAERPNLDAVVKATRLRGIECTSLPAVKIVAVLATGIDGSGAQSLFALAKEGRKHAIASLLVKQGIGVRDAWVSHGMTKAQAEGMLDRIEFQIQVFDSSLDYLRQALGHALSANVGSGTSPPFGLMDFIETLGLPSAHPEPLPGDVLLARLLDAVPARMRSAASVTRALKQSARWPGEFWFLESWFEDGGDLDALLGGKKMSQSRRRTLVLEQYLPARRARWSEVLCWTAEMLRLAPGNDSAWMDFVLVAREFAGDRPLAEIPPAAMIAATTVEAWQMRQG